MSPLIVGLLGILLLVFLLLSRMWIGSAMAFIGFFGYVYLDGWDTALAVLGTVPYSSIADYGITVIPLFMLMGNLASNTGICEDLYKTGHKWMGAMPGGLAMGTIGACAGFAAVCGSSMATAATIGKVALPEMRKYGYSDSLATGSVASGGTLGILIPPSLGFILFGILTEESIGSLFMAGIIPGIMLAVIFMLTIYIITKRKPQIGPPGLKSSFTEKIISLKYTWAMLVIFLIVMGGIYSGIFTPNEAGAIGAFGAMVITLVSRKLTKKIFVESLLQAGEVTAMIVVLLTGAMIFMRFLAISELPFKISDVVSSLHFNRYVILAIIIVFYIVLGMFLDIIASVILTVPIIYPTIMALGFDPIWFGVLLVLVMEMGLITPPIGLNVFVLAGVSDVPLGIIFRGVFPFVLAMIVFIVILSIFPQIAVFLPNLID